MNEDFKFSDDEAKNLAMKIMYDRLTNTINELFSSQILSSREQLSLFAHHIMTGLTFIHKIDHRVAEFTIEHYKKSVPEVQS